MGYDSEIQFTFDTICPWTYLARQRMLRALRQVRESNPPVNFTIKYMPFELYPESSQEGEDKFAWYRKSRYGDSEGKMATYMALMTAFGEAESPPIAFKFGGTVANTLRAHRVIQHFQQEAANEEEGGGGRRRSQLVHDLVGSLYRQYFEEERHPSSRDTLLTACRDAGIDEAEARAFIDDDNNDDGESAADDIRQIKALVREQKGNGIDAVPYVMIEGRKRDFTLEGCREVEEYVKTFQQVVKEAS